MMLCCRRGGRKEKNSKVYLRRGGPPPGPAIVKVVREEKDEEKKKGKNSKAEIDEEIKSKSDTKKSEAGVWLEQITSVVGNGSECCFFRSKDQSIRRRLLICRTTRAKKAIEQKETKG